MFVEIFQYLTLLNLIIGIIGAFAISPIFKFIKKLIVRMKDIYTLSNRLKKLDDIHAQLMPNGGSSIKDAVDRIERKLAFNTEWIKLADRDSGRVIMHLDAKGNLEWANREFLSLFDMELEEALGNGWLSRIERQDFFKFSESLEASIEDARDINVELKLNGKVYLLYGKIIKTKTSTFGYLATIAEVR